MGFQLADLVSPRSYDLEMPFAILLLSAAQSLFFRRRAKHAYLWILLHAASGLIALLIPQIRGDYTNYSITLFEALLGALLTGAMFAIPGAAALALMFSRHEQTGAA
jgi:hypothetical protein